MTPYATATPIAAAQQPANAYTTLPAGKTGGRNPIFKPRKNVGGPGAGDSEPPDQARAEEQPDKTGDPQPSLEEEVRRVARDAEGDEGH